MLHASGALAVGERVQWSDAGGAIDIERVAPRTSLVRVRGFLSDELDFFARSRTEALLDELGANGDRLGLMSFHDWAESTGHSPGARAGSTNFLIAHRKQYALVCILSRSPLVALGITIANMFAGGIIMATTSRAEFEETLQRALGDEPRPRP